MTQETLIVIRALKELEELKVKLKDFEYWAVDTETTGIDSDSLVIGFSLSSEVNLGYYIVVTEWNCKEQKLVDLETKKEVTDFMEELKKYKLIMHNSPFDCRMIFNNFKVQLIDSVHTDTMILAHLIDENRRVGLKDLAVSIFGEDSTIEQKEMKESVTKNGGVLTKTQYELYKGDPELIARYGAKDAILTIKLFYHLIPELYEQELDKFFYEEESMPLLKGPTYQLNNEGLRVDTDKLAQLRKNLEVELMQAKAFIHKEIAEHVKDKYPGTGKANHFNIGASKQLSWLLFHRLGNTFYRLTEGGREICKALGMKLPYTNVAKRNFISTIIQNKNRIYQEGVYNYKTKKTSRPKKVQDPWNYIACGKNTLSRFSEKYKWVDKLLEYSKNLKLLNTYVEGIESRMKYGIIHPSFLQHGTTSGRYSSKQPNFQNLPRDDKRIKACIISRPGKVFVGADYSQLEPRVFASFSKDERLLKCFKDGEDFYSVIGRDVFKKYDCTIKKDDSPNSFPVKYKKFRDAAKIIALATPYGTLAPQMSGEMENKAGQIRSMDECQEIIDAYFEDYPSVQKLMLDSHKEVKERGIVYNLFGRPRRIPEALKIAKQYGKNTSHSQLPREARNLLNLAMNHPIQSTGASIMNRAAIEVLRLCKEMEKIEGSKWSLVKIVLQVHDEIILECPQHLAQETALILKKAMETTTELPGVDLIAEPKIANNLADLK